MSDPLDSLLDRPIAFQRGYVTITGSITAALMLSQAYYWSGRTGDPDGWFYKTQEEWTKETGMTRLEQESARKILRELGLVEENYERLTHRMWYRLDKSKLRSLCLRMSETDIGECGKPAVGNVGNRHSSNSAETTTETTLKGFEKEESSIQKPSSQKPPPTPSEQPALIAWWTADFKARTKSDYHFSGKDAKSAKTLLKHFGSKDAVIAFIKKTQARSGEFEFKNATTLGYLADKLSALLAALARPKANGFLPSSPVRGSVTSENSPRASVN